MRREALSNEKLLHIKEQEVRAASLQCPPCLGALCVLQPAPPPVAVQALMWSAKARQFQMQLEKCKGENSALMIELKKMEVSHGVIPSCYSNTVAAAACH